MKKNILENIGVHCNTLCEINFMHKCMCVLWCQRFLTASYAQKFLEASIQVGFWLHFFSFLSYPVGHCQHNLTKSLLLPWHFPAQKPSVFKRPGSISTPQHGTESTIQCGPELECQFSPMRPPPSHYLLHPNWPPDWAHQILSMYLISPHLFCTILI